MRFSCSFAFFLASAPNLNNSWFLLFSLNFLSFESLGSSFSFESFFWSWTIADVPLTLMESSVFLELPTFSVLLSHYYTPFVSFRSLSTSSSHSFQRESFLDNQLVFLKSWFPDISQIFCESRHIHFWIYKCFHGQISYIFLDVHGILFNITFW